MQNGLDTNVGIHPKQQNTYSSKSTKFSLFFFAICIHLDDPYSIHILLTMITLWPPMTFNMTCIYTYIHIQNHRYTWWIIIWIIHILYYICTHSIHSPFENQRRQSAEAAAALLDEISTSGPREFMVMAAGDVVSALGTNMATSSTNMAEHSWLNQFFLMVTSKINGDLRKLGIWWE